MESIVVVVDVDIVIVFVYPFVGSFNNRERGGELLLRKLDAIKSGNLIMIS